MPETLPPALVTEVPGPRSRALAERLARVECRDTTCLVPEPPIFWDRAEGANVVDVDGNRFVDLGAGFGVACAGHAHPRIVRAVQAQAARCLHAMGDVHPPTVKVELLEALADRFPGGGEARAILGSSGSDAVEAALETALLATGRAGGLAFEGGYHGLSLGALDVTHRPEFRAPFRKRLPGRAVFAAYGDAADAARCLAEAPEPIGAVVVEPIQGRGGERIPPPGFLRELRALCDREGALLVVDEIYTGCGRTGHFFACEAEGVIPDLLLVGKGLSSGMPISACMGRAAVLDAWPASRGEALHTQTFLGHPPSCAAALASLAVIEEEKLVERSRALGESALSRLRRGLAASDRVAEVRGRGLMLGIECRRPEDAQQACREALRRGVIAIVSGAHGEVVSITPPLVIGEAALAAGLDLLVELLA